ncbi:MAG TPA: tetratricopeptide repeat protein [Acidobacteriaceae bacterium]|nr:tetratricopeptide repeat protein [Acidobacteriaceae bacterium]
MSRSRLYALSVLALAVCVTAPLARAGDLRITLPRRSKLTPVQRLNREGVEAVQKRHYDKAEALFYKAYLFDPSDPFTLNNLGYISELQGQLDRAQNFYKLAAEQGCGAIIAVSDDKNLQGKPMMFALDTLKNEPMRINRMNVEALQLLNVDNGFEALMVLRRALKMDPQNPFTLNNLGVASEAIGDYEGALRFYDEAADLNSSEPVVVTLKKEFRGKPVSRVAAASANNLRKRMHNMDLGQARAHMLELRGVFEVNENDWADAKKDFLEAYKLDPYSAFALNNLGYVAERDGDLETAQYFYARARGAADAHARVGLATHSIVDGSRLNTVAEENTGKVDDALQGYARERRQEQGPIELTPRYGSIQPDASARPTTPPASKPQPPQ